MSTFCHSLLRTTSAVPAPWELCQSLEPDRDAPTEAGFLRRVQLILETTKVHIVRGRYSPKKPCGCFSNRDKENYQRDYAKLGLMSEGLRREQNGT
jgi:hypothetical protein